ncbi:metallophosphoesterase [Brachybacterium sp. GCM10030267]|uniref:metallophosphoesterase n=1 Tax=Brachybacterium sp. GCM10030267 TaxID=3273381 RepID=UPI003620D78F
MSAPLSVASLEPAIRRPRRQRAAVILLAGLLALLVGAGWLLWDNRRLDVTSYQVPVQQLPAAADGVRIAQLSDVHAASFGTFPDRIVSAVRSAEPDLIALTGDLIDIRTADLGASLDLAEQLAGIAPVYYVLGNHEADSPLRTELLEGLEEREVHVLRDEATTLELPETTLTLVGLDDPRVDHAADREATPPETTLAGLDLPRQSPTVLLAHRPELWSDYAAADVDVVLSGHAHGGQVRVPGLGGLFSPHQGWLPELTDGVHTREGTTMVISRGLGNSIAGVRVNNPRELVVVELNSAAD